MQALHFFLIYLILPNNVGSKARPVLGADNLAAISEPIV
jgi:hypothetical protein